MFYSWSVLMGMTLLLTAITMPGHMTLHFYVFPWLALSAYLFTLWWQGTQWCLLLQTIMYLGFNTLFDVGRASAWKWMRHEWTRTKIVYQQHTIDQRIWSPSFKPTPDGVAKIFVYSKCNSLSFTTATTVVIQMLSMSPWNHEDVSMEP